MFKTHTFIPHPSRSPNKLDNQSTEKEYNFLLKTQNIKRRLNIIIDLPDLHSYLNGQNIVVMLLWLSTQFRNPMKLLIKQERKAHTVPSKIPKCPKKKSNWGY